MHPYEEAIDFLLNYVVRHGDGPAAHKAQHCLDRIQESRESENAAPDVVATANGGNGAAPAEEQPQDA